MTLDTARLVANVNHRAQRLYEDGYHAVWVEEPYEIDVTNEEGTTYRVNDLFESCSCPFWRKHRWARQCKHLLGWRRLMEEQAKRQRALVIDEQDEQDERKEVAP